MRTGMAIVGLAAQLATATAQEIRVDIPQCEANPNPSCVLHLAAEAALRIVPEQRSFALGQITRQAALSGEFDLALTLAKDLDGFGQRVAADALQQGFSDVDRLRDIESLFRRWNREINSRFEIYADLRFGREEQAKALMMAENYLPEQINIVRIKVFIQDGRVEEAKKLELRRILFFKMLTLQMHVFL